MKLVCEVTGTALVIEAVEVNGEDPGLPFV